MMLAHWTPAIDVRVEDNTLHLSGERKREVVLPKLERAKPRKVEIRAA